MAVAQLMIQGISGGDIFHMFCEAWRPTLLPYSYLSLRGIPSSFHPHHNYQHQSRQENQTARPAHLVLRILTVGRSCPAPNGQRENMQASRMLQKCPPSPHAQPLMAVMHGSSKGKVLKSKYKRLPFAHPGPTTSTILGLPPSLPKCSTAHHHFGCMPSFNPVKPGSLLTRLALSHQ